MSNESTSPNGTGLFGPMFLIFLTLKLTGYISWSWWWVTAPFWSWFLLFVAVTYVQQFGRARTKGRR